MLLSWNEYIIAGKNDTEFNKAILHGSKTFDELKENFGIYETIKSKSSTSYCHSDTRRLDRSQPFEINRNKSDKPQQEWRSQYKDDFERMRQKRCYKCNQTVHISSDCQNVSVYIRDTTGRK